MKSPKKVVDDKRVRKYIELARRRLKKARADGAPGKLISKAERYLSDGVHYFSVGDNATALASISYSHGLLDGSTSSCVGESSVDRNYRKRVLSGVFLGQLTGRNCADDLAGSIAAGEKHLKITISHLMDEGLLDSQNEELVLTPSGRSEIEVGLVAGVFDLIHPGHLAFLNWARDQVNTLVAIVARDPMSQSRKGRKPVQSENDRLRLVSELKPVDYATLGDQNDIYSPVLLIKPDLILLGKDQDVDGKIIRADLKKRGLNVRIIRSSVWDSGELSKTTRIFGRIAKDIRT